MRLATKLIQLFNIRFLLTWGYVFLLWGSFSIDYFAGRSDFCPIVHENGIFIDHPDASMGSGLAGENSAVDEIIPEESQ